MYSLCNMCGRIKETTCAVLQLGSLSALKANAPKAYCPSLATRSLNSRHSAHSAGRAAADLGRLLAAAVARVQPAGAALEDARVLDGRGVAVVGVDARDDGRLVGDADVGEGRVALVLRLAVAAGAVELANVAGQKVLDGDRSAAVVLEHLVRGATCAAAVDIRGARLLQEGDSVLADIGPPAAQAASAWEAS